MSSATLHTRRLKHGTVGLWFRPITPGPIDDLSSFYIAAHVLDLFQQICVVSLLLRLTHKMLQTEQGFCGEIPASRKEEPGPSTAERRTYKSPLGRRALLFDSFISKSLTILVFCIFARLILWFAPKRIWHRISQCPYIANYYFVSIPFSFSLVFSFPTIRAMVMSEPFSQGLSKRVLYQ